VGWYGMVWYEYGMGMVHTLYRWSFLAIRMNTGPDM